MYTLLFKTNNKLLINNLNSTPLHVSFLPTINPRTIIEKIKKNAVSLAVYDVKMTCGFFFAIWTKWNIVIPINVNVNLSFFKYRFEANFSAINSLRCIKIHVDVHISLFKLELNVS